MRARGHLKVCDKLSTYKTRDLNYCVIYMGILLVLIPSPCLEFLPMVGPPGLHGKDIPD